MIYFNKSLLLSEVAKGTPLYQIAHRGTGRSTAQVLTALSRVINNPCDMVQLIDHARSSYKPTQTDAKRTGDFVLKVITRLGLEGILVEISKDHDDCWYVNLTNSFVVPASIPGPVTKHLIK